MTYKCVLNTCQCEAITFTILIKYIYKKIFIFRLMYCIFYILKEKIYYISFL